MPTTIDLTIRTVPFDTRHHLQFVVTDTDQGGNRLGGYTFILSHDEAMVFANNIMNRLPFMDEHKSITTTLVLGDRMRIVDLHPRAADLLEGAGIDPNDPSL